MKYCRKQNSFGVIKKNDEKFPPGTLPTPPIIKADTGDAWCCIHITLLTVSAQSTQEFYRVSDWAIAFLWLSTQRISLGLQNLAQSNAKATKSARDLIPQVQPWFNEAWESVNKNSQSCLFLDVPHNFLYDWVSVTIAKTTNCCVFSLLWITLTAFLVVFPGGQFFQRNHLHLVFTWAPAEHIYLLREKVWLHMKILSHLCISQFLFPYLSNKLL